VSRPERPIDPLRPLAIFAGDLRALRRERDITYREMSELTYYCPSVLSAAASGEALPTWQVTRAYVLACGGPVPHWQARWREERDRARHRNGTSAGSCASGPGDSAPALDEELLS
jgi:hypothetical protein